MVRRNPVRRDVKAKKDQQIRQQSAQVSEHVQVIEVRK
jgi:hypothetical protein